MTNSELLEQHWCTATMQLALTGWIFFSFLSLFFTKKLTQKTYYFFILTVAIFFWSKAISVREECGGILNVYVSWRTLRKQTDSYINWEARSILLMTFYMVDADNNRHKISLNCLIWSAIVWLVGNLPETHLNYILNTLFSGYVVSKCIYNFPEKNGTKEFVANFRQS